MHAWVAFVAIYIVLLSSLFPMQFPSYYSLLSLGYRIFSPLNPALLVSKVLEKGADPNITNADGLTPLHKVSM